MRRSPGSRDRPSDRTRRRTPACSTRGDRPRSKSPAGALRSSARACPLGCGRRASSRRREAADAENHNASASSPGPSSKSRALPLCSSFLQPLRSLRRGSRCRRSRAAPAGCRRSEHDLIQIRQRRTVGRLAPVVRIAAEAARARTLRGSRVPTNGPKPGIGWRSSRRSPGANGAAKRISSVSGSSARSAHGLSHHRDRAQRRARRPAAVNRAPSAEVRPGRSFTVYIRLSADAVHDSASQGSSSSVLRLTRTSGAPVSRSTARAIASVEPVSDPPRGSAASMSASLLGGAGLAGADAASCCARRPRCGVGGHLTSSTRSGRRRPR